MIGSERHNSYRTICADVCIAEYAPKPGSANKAPKRGSAENAPKGLSLQISGPHPRSAIKWARDLEPNA